MSLLDQASLAVTPNGYKEDILYSVIPNTTLGDMDVVRATTATRVNEQGLIEVVPRNLATYSNDFSNGVWIKQNVTLTANSITNPINGNLDAYRVNITSTGTTALFQEIIKGVGNYTVSIFVKKAETQYVNLGFIYSAGIYSATQFDLNSGTILRNGASVYTFVNSTITDLENGWFKLTHNANINTSEAYPSFLPSNEVWTSGEPRQLLTGNNTTGAYFFGMQTELFATATEYFPTTTRLNIPRIDYTNGSCPSLLVEPQRTNLVTYSQQFDDVTWVKGSSTISANSAISPDGTQNADALIDTATNAEHNINQTTTITSNVASTFSVYLKSGTQPFAMLRHFGASGQQYFCVVVNLDTGTITKTQAGTSTSATSSSITNVGNGWYRVTATCTFASIIAIPILQLVNSATPSIGAFGDNSYTGNGTNSILVWGFQFEQSSYPTSYIPTVASTVTRNADVISKTGISSLIGQTEGTVFVDVNVDLSYAQADMIFINVSDGSSTNWYFIGTNTTNEIRFYFRAGATTYVSELVTLTSGRHKLAFAYKNNDYVAYVDGTQVHSLISLIVGATSQVDLGNNFAGSNVSKQFINSAQLYKTRLTNTELAQLTTL